jgi:hypothetical protein
MYWLQNNTLDKQREGGVLQLDQQLIIIRCERMIHDDDNE